MRDSNPTSTLADLFQRSRYNKLNTALQVATGQFPCSCDRLGGSYPDLEDCSICGGTGWETHSHTLRLSALRFLQMNKIDQKVTVQLLRLSKRPK